MVFYFDDDARKDLFNYAQLHGGRFIPDMLYDSEKYIIISDYNEFLYYQENKTTHFFLINEKFTTEPLLLTRNRFIEAPNFYVNQRKGGPYIDFSFYRGYSDDASIQYKSSVIEIYPKFIHYDSYEEFKAPPTLIQSYNDLTDYIKRKSRRLKKDNKYYFVNTSLALLL